MKLMLAIAVTLVMAVIIFLSVRHRIEQEQHALALVRTNFVKGAGLSTDELREVVKLATQGGAAPVVEISTGHRNGRILVRGKESTIGREVTSTEMWIDRLNNSNGRTPNFRISSAEAWTFTVFNVNGRTARVLRHDSLALPDADKIMNAFAKRNVRYADAAVEQRLKHLDLLSVTGLASNQGGVGQYSASFVENDAWLSIALDMEGDAAVLVSLERTPICY